MRACLATTIALALAGRVEPATGSAAPGRDLEIDLREAMRLADDDPAAGAASLTEAIAALEDDRAALAGDPALVEARVHARLTLARALLLLGRDDDASAVMDSVIRSSWGEALPAGEYGPSLAALYESTAERLAAAPAGKLELACSLPCRAYLDERAVDTGERSLPFGDYWVRIEASNDALVTPLSATVRVGPTRATVVFPAPLGKAEGPATATREHGRARPAPRTERASRLLPRWAELAGIGIGAGAAGGAVPLLLLDGHCPGGGEPTDLESCPDVYGTATAGYLVLGLGASLAVISAILLTVDESNKRSGRR